MSTNTITTTRSRVAAAAAVLFAVAFFLCVASVNVPHDPSDAELLGWWQDSGHRVQTILSGFFAIAAAVFFALVMNHIRAVGDRASAWLSFAASTGTAVIAMLLVTSALRGAIGHLTIVMDEPLPSLDVLRYATAVNYTLVSAPLMSVMALTALGVSVVVLREALLGRWVGYVGLVCAALIAVAVAAQLGAFAIPVANLWMICLGVAIWRADPSAHRT